MRRVPLIRRASAHARCAWCSQCRTIILCATLLSVTLLFPACSPEANYALATEPYPVARATGPTLQVQALPEGDQLRLENLTVRSFDSARIWVNRRYVADVGAIAPGATLIVPLIKFRDQWGQTPHPDTTLRLHEPTPLVLVEIDPGNDGPLLGTVVVEPPPESGQRGTFP